LENFNQLIEIRKEKLDKLRDMGVNPYPYEFEVSADSAAIFSKFDELNEKNVSIAGRIMSVRMMGKAAFCHVQDQSGKIQIYIRKNEVGDKKL
jgi:lysyl-tRNA synthetase class 2